MADSRSETFAIDQSLPAERFDLFLRRRYPAVSRVALQRLIEQGHIRVDGRAVKPTHHPRAGEQVTVHWPEAKAMSARPEAIPLDVLHEDDDLVVVNKQPGLIVHAGTGHEEHTLVNALLHHCAGQLSGIGGVLRPGIVHRLDKDTSGCLVVAKNDLAHVALQAQFAERTLHKAYLGIACGEFLRVSGEIRAAIARHPSQRQRMAAVDEERGGRTARTSYKVREQLPGAALVELTLHTGRTHQIRVHLLHLGHPLFGDPTYGPRHTQRLAALSGHTPPRVMLHAWKLAFRHPRTAQAVACEAPVPDDFTEALQALRQRSK